MPLTRRSFIKWVISAGAVSACPTAFAAVSKSLSSDPKDGAGARDFPEALHSETNAVCHAVRDGDFFPKVDPTKTYDVVIVGGGPSGLAAADEAQKSDFLLLEKEDHVGGNSYAESWEGLNYSTGAAWFSLFSPEVTAAFKKWNFPLHEIKGLDGAWFDGHWVPEFWNGAPGHPSNGMLPYSKDVIKSVNDFCRFAQSVDLDKELERWDQVAFSDVLKDYAPILTTFWDGFGKSNWGAPTQLSTAALGLQAAKDWARFPRYTFEGGMGMGSRLIFDHLSAQAQKRVVTGAAVYNVRREKDKAVVSYMVQGKPAAVAARSVVMAAPKFIARLLVEGLPDEQKDAMGEMRYAPYLVYNLCFDRVVYNRAYDNWVVGAKHFTDFIPADFVTQAQGGDLKRKQVITVYAPKLEPERKDLLDDARVLEMAKAAVAELLALFPDWEKHLKEVRIYRRGHPMMMSTPGLFTKLQGQAGRDMPPIFFANTDTHSDNSDLAYASLNGLSAARKALKSLGR